MMHTNLGRAYFDLGNLGPAERMLAEARDLDPQIPLTHFNLGLVYRAQGAAGPAMEAFETFLVLAPPDDPARSAVESALQELQAEVTGEWTEVVNEAGGYTISGPPTWVHVEDNARIVFARRREDVDHLIDGAPMVMVEAWSPGAMMEDLGLDTLHDPAEVATAAAASLGASHGDVQTAALGGYPAALVDIIGTYEGTRYYGTLAVILLEDRIIRVDGAGPTDQWPDVYTTCIDMINSLSFAE